MGIAGIYQIKYKDVVYIGSAIDINKRWHSHRNSLKYGKHHSAYMQNVYNKYGVSAFEFTIVEAVENIDLLLEREQYWLDWLFDNHTRDNIFNGHPTAGSPVGFKHRQETKDKIGAAHKGKTISLEVIESMRQKKKGKKQTREHIERARQAQAKKRNKEYSFISPDGIIYHDITILREFCREYNIDSGGMSRLWKGEYKQYKGWVKYISDTPVTV